MFHQRYSVGEPVGVRPMTSALTQVKDDVGSHTTDRA